MFFFIYLKFGRRLNYEKKCKTAINKMKQLNQLLLKINKGKNLTC